MMKQFTRLTSVVLLTVAALVFATLLPLYATAPGSPILSNTTLNAAINNSQTTLVLASASASGGSSVGAPAAGQCMLVGTEFMTITAIASTTVTVRRASRGASAHIAAEVIFTGPCNVFYGSDPTPPYTCASQATAPQPWINTTNGNVWFCGGDNRWRGTNFVPFSYGSSPTVP